MEIGPAAGGTLDALVSLSREGEPFAPPGYLPRGGHGEALLGCQSSLRRAQRHRAIRQQPDGLNQNLTTAPFGGHDVWRARVRLVPSCSPWPRGEATDLSVAQAVVGEGDDVPGESNPGDLSRVAPFAIWPKRLASGPW